MLPPPTCLSHAWIDDIQWTLTGHHQDQWWTCVHFPNPSPPGLAFFPSKWPERSSCPQTRCSGRLQPTTMPSGLPRPHLIKRENSLHIIYGPLSHFIFLQCNVLTWGSLELTPLLPWWSVQNPMAHWPWFVCHFSTLCLEDWCLPPLCTGMKLYNASCKHQLQMCANPSAGRSASITRQGSLI